MSRESVQPQLPLLPALCIKRLSHLTEIPKSLFSAAREDPAAAMAAKRLFEAHEAGDRVVLDSFAPRVAGALLKKWLFHLRAPLVPIRQVDLFLAIDHLDDPRVRLSKLRKALTLLPKANLLLLTCLSKLFFSIASAPSGPSAEEIAAMFAMILIWPPRDKSAPEMPVDRINAGSGSILVNIAVPVLQSQFKMKFAPTDTIGALLRRVLNKLPRLDQMQGEYRVWLGAPKNLWAEPEHTLQMCGLQSGAHVVIKQSSQAAPPPYVIAAADLWLAFIEEYRYMFLPDGVMRFVAAVNRVPVDRSGFRERQTITAASLERELSSASLSPPPMGVSASASEPMLNVPQTLAQKRAALKMRASGGKGAQERARAPPPHADMELFPSLPSESVKASTNRPPPQPRSLLTQPSDRSLPKARTEEVQGYDDVSEVDMTELRRLFSEQYDDTALQATLQECGTLNAAIQFLYAQADEWEAERVLYNTLELDVKHRPAPAVPPPNSAPAVLGKLLSEGSINAKPLGTDLFGGKPRPVSVMMGGSDKPTSLGRTQSVMVVGAAKSEGVKRVAGGNALRTQSSDAPADSLPEGSKRADLFREVALLNKEVRRLTKANRELAASGGNGDALVESLRSTIAELQAQLEQVRERCQCGAARVRLKQPPALPKKDVEI